MATIKVSKSLEDALARYKLALQESEHIAERACPSYSIVEIPKLEIADALLESLGLPTAPKPPTMLREKAFKPTQAELEEAAARQKYREQQEQPNVNQFDYSMYVDDNY